MIVNCEYVTNKITQTAPIKKRLISERNESLFNRTSKNVTP